MSTVLIVAVIVPPRETDLLSPGFDDDEQQPVVDPRPAIPKSRERAPPPPAGIDRISDPPTILHHRHHHHPCKTTIPFLPSTAVSFPSAPRINLVPRERGFARVAVVEQVNRLISLPARSSSGGTPLSTLPPFPFASSYSSLIDFVNSFRFEIRVFCSREEQKKEGGGGGGWKRWKRFFFFFALLVRRRRLFRIDEKNETKPNCLRDRTTERYYARLSLSLSRVHFF